ncbi:MAG: hypothetical protein EZS28_022482 [Streblomastix strix]|uniref:Uncharacterized protein n=1 Tax=Streblomastix strix TaxID=222440 RepID=A0A5J4VI28_9EUKA|nr:MAG: hypothetical protein EZS28_022482 [Streblomastix strix]
MLLTINVTTNPITQYRTVLRRPTTAERHRKSATQRRNPAPERPNLGIQVNNLNECHKPLFILLRRVHQTLPCQRAQTAGEIIQLEIKGEDCAVACPGWEDVG